MLREAAPYHGYSNTRSSFGGRRIAWVCSKAACWWNCSNVTRSSRSINTAQNRWRDHHPVEFAECKRGGSLIGSTNSSNREYPAWDRQLTACPHLESAAAEVELDPVFFALLDISVVIVGWNAKHYLELCLESLAAAASRRNTEIVVVDKPSTDASAEMIEARFPYVKLIRSSENLGFAKGNNVAIRQCWGALYCVGASGRNCVSGVENAALRVFNPARRCRAHAGDFRPPGIILVWQQDWPQRSRNSRCFACEHIFYFPPTGRCPWMSWWAAAR